MHCHLTKTWGLLADSEIVIAGTLNINVQIWLLLHYWIWECRHSQTIHLIFFRGLGETQFLCLNFLLTSSIFVIFCCQFSLLIHTSPLLNSCNIMNMCHILLVMWRVISRMSYWWHLIPNLTVTVSNLLVSMKKWMWEKI